MMKPRDDSPIEDEDNNNQSAQLAIALSAVYPISDFSPVTIYFKTRTERDDDVERHECFIKICLVGGGLQPAQRCMFAVRAFPGINTNHQNMVVHQAGWR